MSQINIFNEDGSIDREMLSIAAKSAHKESEDAEMEKALQLSAAGWQAEISHAHLPHPFTGNIPVMSWYWRRPAKRAGRKGRLFRSTNQAFNAMKKEGGA